MPKLSTTLFIIFLSSCFSNSALANQNIEVLENQVFHPNIQTVLFNIKGVPLSYPFIQLNAPAPLILRFDEIGDASTDLSYRIIHCNANWTKSSLKEGEYVKGYPKAPIQNYDYSFNTLTPFTHYELEIPNRQLSFTRSGNYVVEVFNTYDDDVIYLRQRFVIYEEAVKVQGKVKMPDRMSIRDAYQEVDFTVYDQNFPYGNTQTEVQATILQNGNWSNAKYGLKPRFYRPGELVFDGDTLNVFPGGNEYRVFDLRDLSYQSARVYILDKKQSPFFVQLYRDISRIGEAYTSYEDLNGNAFIFNNQGTTPHLDADYLNVLFSLKTDFPYNEGKLFIEGNWTGAPHRERFELSYNPTRNHYETTVPIKQGFYSYRYVLQEEDGTIQPFLEGSYWQTENQYHIFVYFRGISDESSRVIGFQQLNSVLN